jgi:hypothetical protein
MDPPEGGFEIGKEVVEGCVENLMTRDDHIVMSGMGGHWRDLSHGLAQAPAHPVALDRAAGLAADGQAEPRSGIGSIGAAIGLQGKEGSRGALALGGGKKVTPPQEAANDRFLRGAGRDHKA